MILRVGRNNSVGMATSYELDGKGIQYWWGLNFPQPSRPVLWSIQPPVQWVLGLFSQGVKRKNVELNHFPPNSVEVKERVQLSLYSPSGPTRSVLGWNSLYNFKYYPAKSLTYLWERSFWRCRLLEIGSGSDVLLSWRWRRQVPRNVRKLTTVLGFKPQRTQFFI
jgi:hypothetical protein